jgi:type II secretory pathway pseudopilin PulG
LKIFSHKKSGLTIIELLVVNCIISILTAAALLAYFSQKDKAYSIVIIHDLKNFSKQSSLYYMENNSLPYSKGDVIEHTNRIFDISKDVKIKVTDLNTQKPFSEKFTAVGTLRNKSVRINMLNNTTSDISSGKNKSEKSFLTEFLLYFIYILGIGTILVVILIFISKAGSAKK